MPISRYVITIVICGILGTNVAASRINVSALEIESNASTVTAKNGVLVTYDTSLMRADRAVYDKQHHHLALDGHVAVVGYQNSKEQASHIDIDTRTDEVKFQELFYSNANDIWVLTHHADRKDGNYTFGPSLLSSCDVNDPVWKMRFSSSRYDSVAKYMKLYNATVYLWDVPIFYTPYLAFSTDNRRKSGLLFPRLGYRVDEGLVYQQPIFWAINDSMDIEFDPQIRTKRSIGLYATYRFVDSPFSSGKLRVGYFKDNQSFAQIYDLPESQHYGAQFVYERNRLLSPSMLTQVRDGLYMDITWLNDIDYLNLQKSGGFGIFGQSPLQQSIVNYYIDNNRWYGGINAKYFIDTRLPSNDTTIQTLPSMQVHKYEDRLWLDNLTYSFDFQWRNVYRKKGMTMRQAEARLPVEWTTSWADDYLSLTLGEAWYAGVFFFHDDTPIPYETFRYVSNVHYAKLFSDVTAHLGHYVHVMQPSVSYILPGKENTSPVDRETLTANQAEVNELFSVGLPEKQVTLALRHYLYDDRMRLLFFQRLQQRYYPNRRYRTADLENEMAWYGDRWQLYNYLVYSYEYGRIRESSSFVAYQGSTYRVKLGHTFKQGLSDTASTIVSDDLELNVHYAINTRTDVTGRWNYDLKESSLHRWMIGGSYKRDCWSVSATVGADILPRPTNLSGQIDTTQEYTFFIQLKFVPFGGIRTSSLDTKERRYGY